MKLKTIRIGAEIITITSCIVMFTTVIMQIWHPSELVGKICNTSIMITMVFGLSAYWIRRYESYDDAKESFDKAVARYEKGTRLVKDTLPAKRK